MMLAAREVSVDKRLSRISLDLAPGSITAICGPNGAGKSTFFSLLSGAVAPTKGQIRFEGEDVATLSGAELRARRRKFQMIFQDPYGSLNPRMTVGQIIGEPLRINGMTDAAERRKRVTELMELVQSLFRTAQPGTCPRGRRTYVEWTDADLARRFG